MSHGDFSCKDSSSNCEDADVMGHDAVVVAELLEMMRKREKKVVVRS
jgi:hypothetical protein